MAHVDPPTLYPGSKAKAPKQAGQATVAAGIQVPGDPLLTYQFAFQIEGVTVALVTEVSGLGIERDHIEHKYVDKQFNPVTQMIPGRVKWDPITLKRALVKDLYFWEWYLDIENGNYAKARKNCSVLMFSRDHQGVATQWNLSNAWPTQISGPSFDSSSQDFGFEEVTIVYESIERVLG